MTIALKKFIQSQYLEAGKIERLKKEFLTSKPFPHFEFVEFFKEDKTLALLKALAAEKCYDKRSDLFQFMQTNDLNFSLNPVIKEFRDFLLSKEFVNFLKQVTGLKINQGKIDLFGSMYQDTEIE